MKHLMMLCASAALLSLAACDSAVTLTAPQQNTAELGAVRYATAEGADFVSCSGLDSNGDHYTTCSIKDRKTGATKEVVCSYEATGCKIKE